GYGPWPPVTPGPSSGIWTHNRSGTLTARSQIRRVNSGRPRPPVMMPGGDGCRGREFAMRMLTAADGGGIGLSFSPAGDALAAVVARNGVYLWNLSAGSAVPVRMDGFVRNDAPNLYFAPDGRSVSWLGLRGPRTYDRDARAVTEAGLDADGRPFALS